MKSFKVWREDKFTESLPPEHKNKQGGFDPKPEQYTKWKKVDLITLPESVSGTNCGNCKYWTDTKEKDVGFCTFKDILEFVTSRNCCAFWDNPGVKRLWEK